MNLMEPDRRSEKRIHSVCIIVKNDQNREKIGKDYSIYFGIILIIIL